MGGTPYAMARHVGEAEPVAIQLKRGDVLQGQRKSSTQVQPAGDGLGGI